jgi:hypothetical protein
MATEEDIKAMIAEMDKHFYAANKYFEDMQQQIDSQHGQVHAGPSCHQGNRDRWYVGKTGLRVSN